jgi:hypothetical protein
MTRNDNTAAKRKSTSKLQPRAICMARLIILISIGIFLLHAGASAQTPHARKTQNVVVVTIDGMRWQEIFDGADPVLLDHRLGGVKDRAATRAQYWREDLDERREALMPFLWGVVAKDGQIFGDPGANCDDQLTNGTKISFPGYAEMFCGFADPRVKSNKPIPNPNPTVFHFLAAKPEFKGKIAAYCTWDPFREILDVEKGAFPVVAGWRQIKGELLSDREHQVNELLADLPKLWVDNGFDAVTGYAAMAYFKKNHPRIFYVGFGETDEWAHLRRYDCYLDAANRNDRFLKQLWDYLQATPEYAGKTTLLVTTDHGRGSTLVDWTDHSPKTPNAERIWMAALGPDTPKMGIRKNISVTQSQLAATIAELLGEDYTAATPKAAAPLPDVMWQGIPVLRRE